ncbi:hypothetical protein SSYM_1187 [Serratia symbiotica str. Tucson]|uniref:Uncharacterized protein n=1 Tax=Serratia symbiotica str. Tucson TaxID=914128 RepID=E9CLQ3_9GAMM|nr:hypothetical protein [Serratia symbiotica]EFW12565.1 hypothetical protein SSYM_1187 [Serratia symbiotica str. Tucson]
MRGLLTMLIDLFCWMGSISVLKLCAASSQTIRSAWSRWSSLADTVLSPYDQVCQTLAVEPCRTANYRCWSLSNGFRPLPWATVSLPFSAQWSDTACPHWLGGWKESQSYACMLIYHP